MTSPPTSWIEPGQSFVGIPWLDSCNFCVVPSIQEKPLWGALISFPATGNCFQTWMPGPGTWGPLLWHGIGGRCGWWELIEPVTWLIEAIPCKVKRSWLDCLKQFKQSSIPSCKSDTLSLKHVSHPHHGLLFWKVLVLAPSPTANLRGKFSRTPHLLVQIRSLGIVEICGKNHGGLMGLGKRWDVAEAHLRGIEKCKGRYWILRGPRLLF